MWIFLAFLVGVVFLVFWSGPASLPGNTPKGINTLEKVKLSGSEQWISIRAVDRGKPVLLFLHGGPGSANLALLRKQAPELEQHFVVVNWDQRGAGKSVKPFANEHMTVAQLQADTHALVEYLKARFGVEKVYLVGFSWGTVLGLSYAADHPENLYAYIGVGQYVNALEGELLSLEYVREQAQQQDNQEALVELAHIASTSYTSADWFDQLMIQRKWLLQFGGVYHTRDSYNHEAWMLFTAPEYSLVDFMFWPSGSSHSLKQMYPEVLQVNFFKTIPQVEIPVYFLVGRYDYNTPHELVERYCEQLSAPAGKQLIWFENSAHAILWDEPEKFAQTIIHIEQNLHR